MATAVLIPSGRPHPHPQSILLQHPSFIPMHSLNLPSANRRIRFAPLPDPRRSVLITDDGNELPFPQSSFPAPPTPSPTQDLRTDYFTGPDNASLSSSSSESKRNSDSLLPSSSSSVSSTSGTTTPLSITTATSPSEHDHASSVPPSPVSPPLTAVSSRLSEHSTTPVPSSSKRHPFSFFSSLKRMATSSSESSSTTITPTATIDRSPTPTFSRRNFSAEEILTLGTINLFRPSSSRDTSDSESTSTASTSWGWSLSRFSSNASHHHSKEPTWGHPLTRAASTQSYQPKPKPFKAKASSKPRLVPGSRKGTRMLNGRVYGVKPPQNANPFANARDDEPEFVEWGYGGMGSVKGATHAGAHSHWERLQGTSATGPATPAAAKDGSNEDEDDGSGMAWLKKRKEQREKEQKEKEEKERLEREALENAESADTETPLPLSPPSLDVKDRMPSRPGTATSAMTAMSASSSNTVTPSDAATPRPTSLPMQLSLPLPAPTLTVTPPTSSSSAVPPSAAPASTPSGEEEHVTRAINIPAPAHHYHHRPHSRAGSKDQTMMLDAITKLKDVSSHSPQHHHPPSDRRNSTSASESETETEDDDDADEEDEEDEESSDEDQRTEERKTALGAGVEKISRHHSS